jgi:GTPase SAR1 family protein
MIDDNNIIMYLNSNTYDTPKINIAVVGDHNVGKTKLINFWLDLKQNSLSFSNIYSKIFWLNNIGIQLNIHKISEFSDRNYLFFQNKQLHAIVYIYNINEIFSKLSISKWIEYMQENITNSTYQIIIGLSNDNINNYDNCYRDESSNIMSILSSK